MKKFLRLLAFSFFIANIATAQPGKRQREFNLAKSSLGISGYDPVAYFKQGKAVEGNKNFTIIYEGVTYLFASAQNLELFKAKPASYEPQYGGWCAYAMGAKGEKVEVDPGTFKITNGKLYLFYNKYFTNTLKSWNQDETNLKTKADANWGNVYKS